MQLNKSITLFPHKLHDLPPNVATHVCRNGWAEIGKMQNMKLAMYSCIWLLRVHEAHCAMARKLLQLWKHCKYTCDAHLCPLSGHNFCSYNSFQSWALGGAACPPSSLEHINASTTFQQLGDRDLPLPPPPLPPRAWRRGREGGCCSKWFVTLSCSSSMASYVSETRVLNVACLRVPLVLQILSWHSL